jgi:ferredoxin
MKATFIQPDGSEKQVEVPPGMSLLEAGEEAGLDLPCSCRSGACSDCTGKLVSGTVDQSEGSYLSDSDIDHGFCLTCVAKPLTDVVVRTGVKDEL